MQPIVDHKKICLEAINKDITQTQQILNRFNNQSDFPQREERLAKSVGILECDITKTQRSVFLGDKSDCEEGTVYKWITPGMRNKIEANLDNPSKVLHPLPKGESASQIQGEATTPFSSTFTQTQEAGSGN